MNEEEKKAIHKEYELGRAQAEYEVNEYWKSLIKEKIEELKNNIPYLSKFSDWKEENYTNEDMINEEILVLQELLEERN